MRTANRFVKGSSVYACNCCDRKTRQTGRGDNEFLKLCAECFDLGGVENEICDSGSTPALEAEAEALRKKIIAKGGTLDTEPEN
jgi:hypothetical protein